VQSLRRLIEAVDVEVDAVSARLGAQLARDPGYRAIQAIPGVGPVLGAVFVAEIGDVTRFDRPERLCCWAGLTPRHRESDTTVHRGPITKMGCGGRGLRRCQETSSSPGGRRVSRGWDGHSSSAVDVRLRGSGQR
jgi:hypothetical protein